MHKHSLYLPILLTIALLLSSCSSGNAQTDVSSAPVETTSASVESMASDSSVPSSDVIDIITYDLKSGEETTSTINLDTEVADPAAEAEALLTESEIESAELQTAARTYTIAPDESLLDEISLPRLSSLKATIFGADDRKWLTRSERTSYPNSAIVSIDTVYASGNWYTGTGFMIGPDTVATCAHMIYAYQEEDEPIGIWVYAGRDGEDYPYGEVEGLTYSYNANYKKYSKTYYSNEGMNYDYAVIKLASNLGNTTGWFGLRANTIPKKVTMTGYYGCQENTQTGVIDDYDDYLLYYTMDTLPGMSGSPIFDTASGLVCGINIAQNDYSNKAVRITSESYTFFAKYCETVEDDYDQNTEGYVFPDSDFRYLTDEDIKCLDEDTTRYAINEIYARHGYIFSKAKYKKYYSQFDWYEPTYKKQSTVEKKFNAYEKTNMENLNAYASQLKNAKSIDGMIFADSDSRYLREEELTALTHDQVRFAVNEIYARHGYKFSKATYKDYFSKYSWYQPTTTDSSKVEKTFNKYETANIAKMSDY